MKTGVSRKKSPNDWLSDMMSNGKEDVVPPGWMTASQIAKAQNVTHKTICNRMDALILAGKIQKQQFRVRFEGIGVRTVWHYAPAN